MEERRLGGDEGISKLRGIDHHDLPYCDHVNDQGIWPRPRVKLTR